ncbi:DNA topoisomerase 2-binding protein 1-A isoform X3 [Trichogramma pretiosum]|uniref:DNA topoisomerase 2-binding protein 1-A isoform X3 n=1 Tax=Trichogramma pretiosum TaxID=7493 RepID=UPI000C719002|nr:DNA topoisomerase 2-binding protein 1-A isoform X3 [Trichogramma pretiosum]
MEGETTTNQTTFDVNVYFVVPDTCQNEKECDEKMWEAFRKCSDWDIIPEWIEEKKCLKMRPDKKDVYVFEKFDGEVFEKLQTTKCTIVGAHCLLSCFLSGEPIPETSSVIFNTAMKGMVVSASGFSANIKNEIQKKVQYMSGIFTKQLRGSVTHLVTDNVFSAKYERAAELKIKVVTQDWVESVWDTNLTSMRPASDAVFDKYKCPVFLNLVVTSTNLNKRDKEDVKRLIITNGGEFMGILDGTKVKIVITVETSGLSDKLKYAMQNGIPCLEIKWVYDSLDAGYALPFSNYLIKSTQACSTPEKKGAQEPFDFSTISVIGGNNQNVVDETIASRTIISHDDRTMNLSNFSSESSSLPQASYITTIDRLNVTLAKKAGPFLDGCNIYLAGFSSSYKDKLNKILNGGSATRLDEISEALTHVIVGDPIKANQDLRVIKSKNLYPYILQVEWLEECMKLKQPAPEDKYLFDMKDKKKLGVSEPPPSPLSKKNLQLLQKPKIPAAPLFNDDDNNVKPEHDEHAEIVQQYLQKTKTDHDESLREILKLPKSEKASSSGYNTSSNLSVAERWTESMRRDNTSSNNDHRDDSAIPVSQDTANGEMIFQGLVFVIFGYEGVELATITSTIKELGGKVVKKHYSGIPDYGVVPKFGAELMYTVNEIVTELFIEDCIDNEKVVNVEYFHRPITIKLDEKPLSNCVIGMSTYTGTERSYLSRLAEALGAQYQDTFARRTNLQKNTYSSTHLICPKPSGEKYIAAVKWRLPAVTADWLLECAAEMKLVDETPHLVGETMAPERPTTSVEADNQQPNVSEEADNQQPNVSEEPDNQQPNVSEEPELITKRQSFMNKEQFMNGSGETPIINKRLNNLISDKTPQSPFHISTPETPYGQIFKDNPSPRTRKGWVKWINHFPDVPVEEPPQKRRRSTVSPLSEVKRKAWDFVTGRLDDEKVTEDETEEKTIKQTEDDTIKEHATTQMSTNRRLSFSDDGSPTSTPKHSVINLASNTPEARQSLLGTESAENLTAKTPVPGKEFKPVPGTVKESQPESVGWENPLKLAENENSAIPEENSMNVTKEENTSLMEKSVLRYRKFMFSGIKEKSPAEKLILSLGGEVSTESSYDPTATHLLCFKPARNEKVLSSIAAGKWVLHYFYIEACANVNGFVDEEEFEMGNPKSQGNIPEPSNESEKMIMSAAYRWRLKLLKQPGGAFCNMVALLITQKEKREQFERLILAGGGIVVEAKAPYDSPNGRKITHCFIQMKQIEQQVDWAMMASKGILCFPPQHLNDQLMSEYPLNPRDCVLPEFQKYLALIPK